MPIIHIDRLSFSVNRVDQIVSKRINANEIPSIASMVHTRNRSIDTKPHILFLRTRVVHGKIM